MKTIFELRNLRLSLAVAFLLCVIVSAFLGALIRPDKSADANRQFISIAQIPPFSKIQMLKVRKNRINEHQPWYSLLLNGGEVEEFTLIPVKSIEYQEHRVKVEVLNTSGIEENAFFIYQDVLYPINDSTQLALAADRITSGSILLLNGERATFERAAMIDQLKKEHLIFKRFVLGTDPYGRDMLSRIMAGGYVTLMVGLSSVLISLIVGVFAGVLAGYYKGIIDKVMLWIMNVFSSIPAILLVICVTLVFGQGILALIVGISFILWVEMAQVIRGEVMSLSKKEYIKAARLMGLSQARIVSYHILPNLVGPILVLSVSNFAQAILIEAGLNFLGVGISLPTPSWGGMIRELYGFLITDGAFMAIAPSLAIVFLVLSTVTIGDAIKTQYDLRFGLRLK